MRLQDRVLEYFKDGELRFKSFGALISSIANETNAEFKDVSACINKLISSGVLSESGKHRLVLTKKLGVFKGKLCGNQKGFAFVKPETQGEDFFVPAKNLNGALDGDEVLYRPKGDTAEIIKILKRGNQTVVGKVVDFKNVSERHRKDFKKGKFVVANNLKFSKPILVPDRELRGADVGDNVVIDLIYQPENSREVPCGRVVEVLRGNDVETAIETVLTEKNIPKYFSGDALNEAENLKVDLEKEKTKRVDLTGDVIFTIDGADAKDLDDAVSIKKTSTGYVLGVHIADVGNFVNRDGMIDEDAFYRATSVYFPNKVYPMLPKKLSNDLCSLNADEPKLALSVEANLNTRGEVLSYKIFESIIKSVQRLTYVQAFKAIRGEESGVKPEVASALKDMAELSEILSETRKNAGALDLDIAECQFVFDENGEVVDVQKRERNNSHKLIENFMVLANEIVAKCFSTLEVPFVYRVHGVPIKTKFDEIVAVINGLGAKIKFEKKITPKYVQNILNEIAGEEYSEAASKLILCALEKAVYSPECEGHFGLALDYYSHFTSPIRRYPDLTIHRIIKSILPFADNRIIDSKKLGTLKTKIKFDNIYELEEFVYDASLRSSERERNADEAERSVDDIFKAKLMLSHVGEIFDAKVSGVKEFGVFVELENTVEGLIRLENLPQDDYNYEDKKLILSGKRNKFFIGKKVKVKLTGASVEQRRVDFELAKNVEVKND